MEKLFKIKTRAGNGIISTDGNNFFISLNGKTATCKKDEEFAKLNGVKGNQFKTTASTIKALTGARLPNDNIWINITALADGGKIAKGKSISVKPDSYNNITEIRNALTATDTRVYTGKMVDSGYGFMIADTAQNWALVQKYGDDAIEKN